MSEKHKNYIVYILSQYTFKKQLKSPHFLSTVPDMCEESLGRLCRSLGDPGNGS